jgi:formate dehydrogenase major subunit
MPDAVKGLEKLDLLVIADPHPTSYVSMGGRKNGTYLLADLHAVRDLRLAHGVEPLPAMGRAGREAIFESRDDYDVMYRLAKKLGFADRMFKNIKVENDIPVAEDVLREINRGGWSTGYCGQSPERLKAHMRNQHKFDLVTLRAPSDDPEIGATITACPGRAGASPRSGIRARPSSTTPTFT